MQQGTALAGVKEAQRKHWDGVAWGWAKWIDWTERNFAPITDWFQTAGAWKPGAQVLDVAGGAGYPALVAAAAVGPGGRVVATDLAPEMVAAIAERSRALGLRNVQARAMDAEHLDFEDRSFDAVTSAYGLMFCPDPSRAAAEARRVLEPGGVAAFVTWDEASRSPFFSTMLPVAARFLGLQPPDPGAPGPFRLSTAKVLEDVLRDGGFTDVRVERRVMTVECASAREYLEVFSDVAWKGRLGALSNEERTRFADAVAAAAAPYISGTGVRLVASSLCARACR